MSIPNPGLQLIQERTPEVYLPAEDERKFILNAYRDFLDDKEIKDQAYTLLGPDKTGSAMRSLQTFWDESNSDYNANPDLIDLNDPVVPYSSGISRDKANSIITPLVDQYIYPSVIAQNSNQEIDNVMSRCSRVILEWAHDNDGRPSSNGHTKTKEYVHKMVIEGTVHVQDDIIDGKLDSSMVPNEEIFIPNFFQPNIQLQGHLIRVQNNVTYFEGDDQFGEIPNWKYVMPGSIPDWIQTDPKFKSIYDGIKKENAIQIVRIWRPVPVRKLKELIGNGTLLEHIKRAKYFNIIINGVLMFPADNLMPYHDGWYPITKERLEFFSKPEFYWGNSITNKFREDKKYYDGWKTLLRYKGKISAIPPLLTFNGSFIDGNVIVPGLTTAAPSGMKPEDIAVVPGITTGVNNAELAMLRDAAGEIDRAVPSQQTAGQDTKKRQTAKETIVADQNVQKIISSFAMQVVALIEARTFPILYREFQFLPRRTINKLVMPNQSLPDGKIGSYEIIFQKFDGMTEDEADKKGVDIFKEELKHEKLGTDKRIVYVNPDYLKELDLYVKVTADITQKKTGALKKSEAEFKWNLYSQAPDVFNRKAAARKLVRELDDDENEMILSDSPDAMKQQIEQQQQQQKGGDAPTGPEDMAGGGGGPKVGNKAKGKGSSGNDKNQISGLMGNISKDYKNSVV